MSSTAMHSLCVKQGKAQIQARLILRYVYNIVIIIIIILYQLKVKEFRVSDNREKGQLRLIYEDVNVIVFIKSCDNRVSHTEFQTFKMELSAKIGNGFQSLTNSQKCSPFRKISILVQLFKRNLYVLLKFYHFREATS